ncbi:MAG: TIGR03668 family PPOX class F420-dependent oxidoreductase [Chloroflexia bacterium]|nr:TIGR03668 family PPOX class F420-dependent oxidoreductase [Chloroflexia bacterium]
MRSKGDQPGIDTLRMLRDARIGRLATVNERGHPSVVPFCFAVIGEDEPVVVSVLDEKPKHVPDEELARVRNITHNPNVAFVVDHYEKNWSRLAFVQVRGQARLVSAAEPGHAEAIIALREKYPQYRSMAIEGRAVIMIEKLRLTAWSATGE